MERNKKLRAVVVGGGIGGAELVRLAIQKKGLELVLIEPKDRIECQALYPEYLGGTVDVEDAIAPLKPFCDRMGVTWIRDRAMSVDLDEKVVTCTGGSADYDLLVIATGAVQSHYGVKGAETTFSVNTLEDTTRAREFLQREIPENIVIIGSGLTGVETACALVESLDAAIYVVEMRTRLLPTFPESVSAVVDRMLNKKGVRVLTSRQVKEITEDKVIFSDETFLDSDMSLWTAGIKPSVFVEELNLPKRKGWLLTDPYLRVQGQEDVFAIGDNAWVEVDGKVATKTGIEAERQAKYTAKNLARLAKGKDPFPYPVMAGTEDPMALISIGYRCAVGVYGDTCITMPSMLIYALKSWIDKSFVKRFK